MSTDEAAVQVADQEQKAQPGQEVMAQAAQVALPTYTDVPTDLQQMTALAQQLEHSIIIPRHLRRAEDLLAIMLAARALQIPMWQAMQGIDFIDGKTAMNAAMMRALIVRAGHHFEVIENTAERATVLIIRADDPERTRHTATFTIENAKEAGLLGKDNWKKYPADMLMNRATSRGGRMAAPDVLMGFGYIPEEIESISTGDQHGAENDLRSRADQRKQEIRDEIQKAIDGTDMDALKAMWSRLFKEGVHDFELEDGLTVKRALELAKEAVEGKLAEQAAAKPKDEDVVDAEVVEEPPGWEKPTTPECTCDQEFRLKYERHRKGCPAVQTEGA